MSQFQKFLYKIIQGSSDHNIDFKELINFLLHLGFKEKIKGSHHIFRMEGIEEIINLQPENSKAKAYQVRQIRNIIINYKLGENDGQ